MDKTACQLALSFYRDLLAIAREHQHHEIADRVKQYGRDCEVKWFINREKIVTLMQQEES